MDASDFGAWEVLSQQSEPNQKLFCCAFFPCCLMPTAHNYNISNRELLAIKLALEEWRHWLVGAEHPFIVSTNHRNLEYIQLAKCLNSCQTCWALFFGRFSFTLIYCPGSKNGKLDALSHQHSPENIPSSPGIIVFLRGGRPHVGNSKYHHVSQTHSSSWTLSILKTSSASMHSVSHVTLGPTTLFPS